MTNAILRPTSGKVFVEGMDTSDEELEIKIRQLVDLVFQNPDNQIVSTIVEEDVAFDPRIWACLPRDKAKGGRGFKNRRNVRVQISRAS